ncbi:MAG: (2Fe-2S)-binding protein [Chloroflexota bacterium]|nr:(2Fe-2S)-binding protein [Chloroflexota bacterium]
MPQRINLKVNGEDRAVEAPARRLLVDLIRYDLGLTGTKEGCSVGVCGACTVLVDGEMVASCITLAAAVAGSEITTIEGLAQDGRLHPVQQAFIDYGGFQCGICTPGQVMAAKALLDENAEPTEEEIRDWMMGNLCRCTGYYKILESVVAAMSPATSNGEGQGSR